MPSVESTCGEIGRSAAGQQVDAVEVAHREDHRKQGAGDVERADGGPGDVGEAMPTGPRRRPSGS